MMGNNLSCHSEEIKKLDRQNTSYLTWNDADQGSQTRYKGIRLEKMRRRKQIRFLVVTVIAIQRRKNAGQAETSSQQWC